MRYCLWRIIGNDLYPRHSETQTKSNLLFICGNEPDFKHCEKRYLLNRIINDDLKQEYIEIFKWRGDKWYEIPFNLDEYKACIGPREKVHYLTNVNAARNYCIRKGFEDGFKYVLPFDSGSCFREDGWYLFDNNCRINDGDPYFVLGQWRPLTYDSFLNDPQILKEIYIEDGERVTGMREFTIAFGEDYDQLFNENLIYGQADKVELLWRLDIPGIWDRWHPELQENIEMSKFAGQVKMAGWVARLPSGNSEADQNNIIRAKTRVEGMHNIMQKINNLAFSVDKIP